MFLGINLVIIVLIIELFIYLDTLIVLALFESYLVH